MSSPGRPGHVGFKVRVSPPRSPPSWPRRTPPARRRSTASRRSTCSSRVRVRAAKRRSVLAAGRRPRGRRNFRCHPAAAQRLPSAQAAPGLGRNFNMARYTGPSTRKSRRLGVDLVGGDQSFESAPTRPASTVARGSRRANTAPSCRRSRRPASPMESWRSSSAATTKRRSPVRQDRREPAPHPREPPGQRRLPAGLARTRRMARQLVSHGHFTVNGVKVNIPELPGVPVRHHRRSRQLAEHRAVPDLPGDRG